VDEYLGASGWAAPARADRGLLERYEARNGREQCRYGCSDCADACPLGVPLADVLRVRMYAEDYGDAGLARREYASLGAPAAACVTCAHHACAGACPHGLDLPGLALRAHAAAGG
jgi:ferredoxin